MTPETPGQISRRSAVTLAAALAATVATAVAAVGGLQHWQVQAAAPPAAPPAQLASQPLLPAVAEMQDD